MNSYLHLLRYNNNALAILANWTLIGKVDLSLQVGMCLPV